MDLNQGESVPATENAAEVGGKVDDLSSAVNAAIEKVEAPVSKPSSEPNAEDVGDQQTEQVETDKQAKPQDEGDKAPSDGQAETLDAPQHWPADRRETFKALPDEARKLVMGFVRDTQAGFTRKMQEVGDKVRFADGFSEVFNGHDIQQIQQSGLTLHEAVHGWKQMAAFYAKDPAGYIRYVAEQSKLDPSQIFPQQQKSQDDTSELDDLLIDPNVKLLQTKVKEFENYFAEGKQREAEQKRQQLHAHVSTLTNAVNGFRSALDDQTGQLRYPHFDQVREAMGALMDTHGKLKSMPDGAEKMDLAYQMAVIADPDLGRSVIDQQVAQRVEAERRKDAANRAKAAGGIRPATGAPQMRPKATSLDDAVSQSLARFG